jgi:uncharacterized protein (UPF0332 family)
LAKAKYTTQAIERAHHWIAKSIDALGEAQVLIPSGRTRLGAYSRLYYSAHHAAVALLRLSGNRAKSHQSIRSAFGQQWVKKRSFPPRYGRLLKALYSARAKADYGEYVPTMARDLEQHSRFVEAFIKRAQKEVPPISTAKILAMIVSQNPEIRDFSFDIYCPKSYYHHTRLTAWCPKGRVSDAWLHKLLNAQIRTLKSLGVGEAGDYVLGLNSRVNQYKEQHVIMLDFDDVSSLPFHRFKGEPGFFFRTHSGYHFIGSKLYGITAWRSRMRKFSRIASKQHFDLSLKRGYGTLRLTTSPRKPVAPAYIGRSR